MQQRTLLFFGLNTIRFFSLLTLILVFASSIYVMANDIKAVKRYNQDAAANAVLSNSTSLSNDTNSELEFMFDCDYIEGSTVPNQAAGVFWAVLNRLFIIFQCIVLFISELGFFESIFVKIFPPLGPDFGVGVLGAMEILIGAAVLSHHVGTFALVSAFFLFSVGCLNLAFGLIFRSSLKQSRDIQSWRHGQVPDLPSHSPRKAPWSFIEGSPKSAPSALFKDQYTGGSNSPSLQGRSLGFGRQGEKAAHLKGFMISKPVDSLPKYVAKTVPQQVPKRPSREGHAISIQFPQSNQHAEEEEER